MSLTRYKTIIANSFRHIWCVGDIHGCYSLLMSGLSDLSFDRTQDLVISVGDNIDRGPENLEILRLLKEPWFETVVGNHEEMAIDAIGSMDGNLWDINGGSWFFKLSKGEQTEAIKCLLSFKEQPHVIEVITDSKKYVIAHADYPKDVYLFGQSVDNDDLLWSCERISGSLEGKFSFIEGADNFIFGHVIFKRMMKFSNQIYIDTGAYRSKELSFYQLK